MKLNTEYPTKDWLKTSENARPLDIIWEKNYDRLQFCSYYTDWSIINNKELQYNVKIET